MPRRASWRRVAFMCADWAKYGLQINAIAPGYFKTPLNQALVDNPEFSS